MGKKDIILKGNNDFIIEVVFLGKNQLFSC